jgi:hypothetical protein
MEQLAAVVFVVVLEVKVKKLVGVEDGICLQETRLDALSTLDPLRI